MNHTLRKNCHLCGETTIAQLYREGHAFLVFPLRVVYRVDKSADNEARPAVKVLFSAPKKRFKHAVDRNRCKRLMRESYRLKQNILLEALANRDMTMDLSFTVIHDRLPQFADIDKCMEKIIDNLIAAIGQAQ